jgi:hypothetical protein
MTKVRLLALLIVLALSIGVPASRMQACAPFIDESVFWWHQLPEVDLAPYSRGELGILSPRYARSYLIVAYRVLSGRTMNDAEARSMKADWDAHLHRHWDQPVSWVEQWKKARARVRGLPKPPDPSLYRANASGFAYSPNVLEDAFKTAIDTLRDRERRFGAGSRLVSTWVRAQDLVFAAASPDEVAAVPLPAQAPDLARADRDYQLASAAFYHASYADARARFIAVARDAKSPWRDLGTYLAARSAIRAENAAEAVRLLEAVVADPAMAKVHVSARGQLLRLRAHSGSDDEFRPWLANELLAPRPGPLFGILVRHLALAIDRWSSPEADRANPHADEPDEFPGEDPETGSKLDTNPSWRFANTGSLRAEHELLDWIVTFQSNDRAAASHALDQWRQRRNTVWLVAAIANLRSLDRGTADVMAAAAAVPPESPAYATVTFHRARLLIGAGRSADARALLDQTLDAGRLPLGSRNRLRDLRLRTARNVDDLVPDLDAHADGLHAEGYPHYRFSPTAPDCGYGSLTERCDELREIASRAQLMPRAAAFINGLPLAAIAKLATDARIPDPVRRETTQAAWVRAFLLGDDDVVRSLGLELSKQYAADNTALAADLMRVGTSLNTGDRRFEAAWILVRYPVMAPFVRPGLSRLLNPSTIDDYGDNWWSQPRLTPAKNDDVESGLLLRPAPFLDAESKRQVDGEYRRLRAVGSAGAFLARTTVESATSRLDDPRVPEALYRAVRATRLVGGGEWSRKAFTLLHQRFPNSPWAKRTPFWY